MLIKSLMTSMFFTVLMCSSISKAVYYTLYNVLQCFKDLHTIGFNVLHGLLTCSTHLCADLSFHLYVCALVCMNMMHIVTLLSFSVLQCSSMFSTPVNSVLELVDVEYFVMDGTTRNAMKPHASHWVHPIHM